MKKLLYIFTILLISCSSDSSDSSTDDTPNDPIIGKWYFEDTQTMYWVDVFNGTIEGNDFNERWSYFNKQ